MRTARLGFILSMIALSCFLFACAETAPTVKPTAPVGKKTTIRIACPFKGGIVLEAAEKFMEMVERGSGGRFEFKIDAGTKAELDITNMNRKGEIEMQSNGTAFLEHYAPPYYFFTNPYVMKDFDHYMRVWNGKLGKQALADMEKNGNLKYLGTIYRGQRQTTAKKPLYTPADAYNMKLRLPNVPSWMVVWK